MPNLVVTKFVAGTDPVVAGAKTDGRVTIKNSGSADAGSFSLGISWSRDDGLGGGADSATTVDGLAAGDSVQVTVNISLDSGGAVTFTATADSGSEIAESNEDDNTLTLHVTAVSLPNLAWAPNDFSIAPDPGNPGDYEFDMVISNTGTEDVTTSFKVGFSWQTSSSSGTFDPFDCCTTEGGPVIAAGTTTGSEGWGGIQFPGTGDYTVTATLDSDNAVAESNENDNTAQATVSVP